MGRTKLPFAPHTGRPCLTNHGTSYSRVQTVFSLRFFRNESLLHQHSDTSLLPCNFSVFQSSSFPQTTTETLCAAASVSTHNSVHFTICTISSTTNQSTYYTVLNGRSKIRTVGLLNSLRPKCLCLS
jgi:hypothetical protein